LWTDKNGGGGTTYPMSYAGDGDTNNDRYTVTLYSDVVGDTSYEYKAYCVDTTDNVQTWVGVSNQTATFTQLDSNASPINWWCGSTFNGTSCPALSNFPAWTEGSPNDTYTYHVFYNNYGDTLCMQYSTAGTVSIGNTQVTCNHVSGDRWTCAAAVGQNLATSTMTFSFYNDNNDGSAGACNGPNTATNSGNGRQVGAAGNFSSGPTSVQLADSHATAQSLTGANLVLVFTTLFAFATVLFLWNWRIAQKTE
jgi:hypothetical protein